MVGVMPLSIAGTYAKHGAAGHLAVPHPAQDGSLRQHHPQGQAAQ
jgi:hypothetical protein